MDDLIQSLIWIAPLLLGALSWLGIKSRESQWGQRVAQAIGFKRREHEQEWEFQRRLGAFWLSIAAIVGVLTYQMGQGLLPYESDAPTWELAVFFVGAISFVWVISKSFRSFWASRRES